MGQLIWQPVLLSTRQGASTAEKMSLKFNEMSLNCNESWSAIAVALPARRWTSSLYLSFSTASKLEILAISPLIFRCCSRLNGSV
eukprot:scaffold32202_cov66-Phaeocystis_antarctica.AAC.2